MTKPLFAAIAALALCLPAAAQNMKPGLWEITSRMQGGSGGQMDAAMADMQKQMAAMPPEQRKMVEEMMARQGVRMAPGGGAGGMKVQICMTREMAERNEVPMNEGDCRTTKQQRSGSTISVAFTCTNPPSSGEGQVTMVGPDAYTSKMAVSTVVNGKPEKFNMDGSGKWLAADCGSVKPFGRK